MPGAFHYVMWRYCFFAGGQAFFWGVVMGGPMSGLPVEVVEVAFQLHVVEAVLS